MPGPPGVGCTDQHDHRLRVHRGCPRPGRVLTPSLAHNPHGHQPPTAPALGLNRRRTHRARPTAGILARLAVTPVILGAQWMLVPSLTDEDTPLDFFVFLAILAG